MSNRTIKAPGVEIFEHDMSEYPAVAEGTHVLLAGFAQKGEDYTPYRLTSRSSWLKFYGAPTNEAEEYFYTAANEVLDKGGYLYSVKIPYSNDIKGIYAASKFRIEECRDLLERDPSGDFFVNLDGTENEEISVQETPDIVRMMDQYKGLKKLGINHLSKIAPQGQDFLSYDLVEEYEAGESKPGSNVIYIVDKTRAVYTRAVKVNDVQENRDSRSCIGIVPVITTLANTAWFQKQSTGLTAPINELYQPVRSLKTITFPAGAASAAEYQPTYLLPKSHEEEVEVDGEKKKLNIHDLSIDLIQENGSYDRSLSEMAAMQAQSCLTNGNMVDGHFAPHVCNEVAVIVFKAFTSTEDGLIDFEVVEQFTGSLDPDARNEKGVSTYIGTIINNTSDYIYFFSNLKDPKTVLKNDHAFVVGSNSDFDEILDKIKDEPEYIAAEAFGAYTARMLGFDNNDSVSAAERARRSLKSFYNQDAKSKCAITNEIAMGGDFSYDEVTEDCGDTEDEEANVATVIHNETLEKIFNNKKVLVSDKYITDKPSCVYKIANAVPVNVQGAIDFKTVSPLSSKKQLGHGFEFFRTDANNNKVGYVPDSYNQKLRVGRIREDVAAAVTKAVEANQPVSSDITEDPYADVEMATYELPENFSSWGLYQLSIFNSTDYLRAIMDFDKLVDLNEAANYYGITELDDDTKVVIQDNMIRLLVVNSLEKTAKYKVYLRRLKKAAAAIDRLDDEFATFVSGTTSTELGPHTARVYVRDLYNSLNHMGVLSGIQIIDELEDTSSGASSSVADKSDMLETRIENLINPDVTKKEKADPTKRQSKKDKKPVVAAQTFLFITDNFPQDSMAFPAIGFAAQTYDSIPDKKNAALTFELAYKRYPKNEETPAFLYSACLSYDEAKMTNEAIRCSKDLVRDYPKSSYAVDAAFSIPMAYANAKKWDLAIQEYNNFIRMYQEDKEKLIAAYIGIARAYRNVKDVENSVDAYKKTLEAYDKYGLQIKNADAAIPAEAAYYMGEYEYNKMTPVVLKGKEKEKAKRPSVPPTRWVCSS